MKKLFTLLAIVGLGLTSCEKDEKIEPKDYTTYTVSANMNSMDGKEVTNRFTGEKEKQYYYSVQYLMKLEKQEDIMGVVNSSSSYANFVLPVNPESELVEKSTHEGDWHIALTQYTTELPYEEEGVTKYMEYGTVGALINTEKDIEVSEVEGTDFDDVSLADAKSKTYSENVDVIGYEWKAFEFSSRTYTIVEDLYFLVKLSENEIYKFRFVDFYGDNPGDNPAETADKLKGHIKFQYQLLK